MSGMRLAIGTMSGTSMDGVDVALIETDGKTIGSFGPTLLRPYDEMERAHIAAALAEGPRLTRRDERPAETAIAERIVTRAHHDAIAQFLDINGLDREAVSVVGFHGQTVFHAPKRRLTVQIGDGPGLARALGIAVVHDFRAADVAAGGEGAPLVPVFHAALAARAGLRAPVAILNIGGVANITLIDADGGLLAFDTGPGNALLDDWVGRHTGRFMDADGRISGQGRVDEARLAQFLAHPFFAAPPPKSLDRNAFDLAMLDGLTLEDGAATLAAFTAAAVARALEHMSGQDPAARPGSAGGLGQGGAMRPATLVVAGGGAHNPTLLRMLAERTGARVRPAGEIGLSTDFLEAQAFAYLAVRSLRGLPLTFPGTTGVAAPTPGGVLARP